jgi:hypothetical protein
MVALTQNKIWVSLSVLGGSVLGGGSLDEAESGLERGYRRLVPCRLFWLCTVRRAGLLVKPSPVPLCALELLSSTITSGAPGFAKPHQCRYISEILAIVYAELAIWRS